MLAMVRARWRADVIRRCVTAIAWAAMHMGRHASLLSRLSCMGPFP